MELAVKMYFTDNDYDYDIIYIWKTSCNNKELTNNIKILALLPKQNFDTLFVCFKYSGNLLLNL